MPRDYRLINFNGEWQVCSKARRGHGDRIVWIYGKERIYFCDVGRESAIYVLPGSEKENFFGDRFNFSIDEVYVEDGRRKERLGGMNNVVAAQRAFTELLSHHSKTTRLQLRQGGFIMRDEFGTDDYKERIWDKAYENGRLVSK
ncbi:hypothetical protein PH562_16810 [Rhizobium sp. CNPSo 4062]|uniref:hypothetical protein n=1 Tax=Rhizobium sp. CNPSo 4062 TaxID=3021410 RepID=UPI0025500CC1|nr:hypothetical protein [Rhizobium sp. CNPSo 4062]MDK4703914.1 hypothetical protein [Rhizobium sp. CNPSo 4062]